MKKIKITEKQAKLLETLNSKKVLKVTKEQYNRIIESELNRPSLTETPELHEEEINEELFREFVNELYGINEEGKELRFEKVCKLMEAAGLIEGGKILKEKFGKDPKKVKEVIGKGLKRLEECGSAYEAVELMEATLNDPEGDSVRNSLKQQLTKPSKNPNNPITKDTIARDKANDERLPGFEKGGKDKLINDIKNILKSIPEDVKGVDLIVKNYLKLYGASKVRDLNDKALDRLLDTANDIKESSEEYRSWVKKFSNLEPISDINTLLNTFPFSELPEDFEDKSKDKKVEGWGEVVMPTSDSEGLVYVPNKLRVKLHFNEFESKFGEKPVFVVNPEGNPLEKIVALNFTRWYNQHFYNKVKSAYLKDLKETSLGGDAASGGVGDISYDTPFGSGKPAFKSNVPEELEEARTNVKNVIINIPHDYNLNTIKRTPTFRNYFNDEQLKNLQVGDNELTVNHSVYGKMKSRYPEGSEPFGLKPESILKSKDSESKELKTELTPEEVNKIDEYLLANGFNTIALPYLKLEFKLDEYLLGNGFNKVGLKYLSLEEKINKAKEQISGGAEASGLTEKIYEALKKKVVTEMDLTTVGNYQYATPGFDDINMKGNHPTGKGKTFKKPAIKGGKFVKIKERCKTFPYCNQGPEAIEIKNKAE